MTTPPPIGSVYLVTPGGLRARGGIGRMVEYFSRHWAVEDAPLTVIDTYGPGAKALMPFHFAAALARLAADAARGRIGVMHIHMSERGSVLRKGLVVHLAARCGIPAVLHLHGADFAEYCRALPPRRAAALRTMMGRAAAVVVLGGYWRDFVVDELGVAAGRVAVLPNAVPGPQAMPERPGGGPCRILFLGVLGDRKGAGLLLKALAAPGLRDRNWTACLAGNGEIDRHRALALDLGLGDRVDFPGWVDEDAARALLARSDLLVLPSRNEGLPMAILEAMAHGLPVVATPVGAVADAVEDGGSGLLVPVGDRAALAEALGRLVDSPGLRRAMGARGRARYLEQFEIAGFNRRLEALFRRVRRRDPGEAATPAPDEEFAR